MSAAYDNKVVEMKFDGKQFEAGVESSYSAIQKLKSALNFGDAAKGFDELEHASKGVKLNGITSAVESASRSFSAFEIVAITALANITNKAVDAGIKMAKSLTIDQMAAGLEQFNRKTTAVSTMMINTGKSIEEVEAVMDKVTWFADETSYSFSEMSDSISKFVSNGVGLEDSATAVQGIATWAAKAGQNSQTASRAMYNLSQAIGIGAVTAQDWKSIEMANMATEDFKNTAIETAKELAAVDKNYAKTFNNANVTTQNFKDTLQKKWLTNDVLIKTLAKYGEYADYLYEHSDEYDTATAAMKALGSAGMDFGMEAFQAAQKARTLEDVANSLKDASKSQWAGMFEKIFGNADYATETFTSLANDAWEVFVGPLSNMKDLIGEVMQPDATKQFGYAVKEAGFDISEFKTQLEIVGKESGKLNATMIAKAGSLEKTLESNWMDAEIYADALERSVMKGAGSLDAYISEVSETWNDYQKNQYKRWTETEGRDIEDLGHTGTGPQQYNDDWMYRQLGLDKERIKNANKLTDAQKEYIENVRNGTEEVMRYNDAEAKQMSGQDKMRSIILDTVGIMKSVSGIFSNVWSKVFPKESIVNGFTSTLDSAYKSIHGIFVALRNNTDGNAAYNAFGLYSLLSNAFEFIANSADLATTAVSGLFRMLKAVFGGNFITASFKVIGEAIGIVSDIIAALTSSIKESFGDMRDLMPFTLDVIPSKILDITKAFRTWLKEGGRLKRMTDTFVRAFKKAGTAVRNFLADFIDVEKLTVIWNKFSAAFRERFGDLANFFTEFSNTISRIISRIKELTKELTLENLKAALRIIGEEFAELFSFLPLEDLAELFTGIVDKISDFGERAGEEISKVINKFSDIYDRAKELASKVYHVFTEGFEKGYVNGILSIIVGVASGAAALTLVQKLSSALTILATPVDMFGQILTNINSVLVALRTDLKAMRFDIYANGFFKIALSMVALAAAMWILKDIDTGFLIGVAIALGVFMGLVIYLVNQAAKVDAIKLAALGSAFFALSTTFLSMAGTMWVLSKVDWEELGKGVGYIIGALVIIAGALTAAAFVPEAAVVKMEATAGAIAAFAFSFIEIGAALWILSKMKIDDVEESMKKMGSVILAMAGMAIAVRIAGPGAAEGAKSISDLGKSMLFLAAGLFLLSKISDNDIARGSAVIALMEGLMLGMAVIARLAGGPNADKAGRGMMSLATTFIIMAAAMAIIGNLSPSEIAKGIAGLIAMSLAMVLIGAALKIATAGGGITGATVASFVAISIAIAVLAASLIAIANLAKDMDNLKAAAHALAEVFASLGVLLFLGNYGNTNGLVELGISIGLLVVVAGALYILANNCDPAAIKTAANAISEILVAVGVMTGIVTVAGKFANTQTLFAGLQAVTAALLAIVEVVVVMSAVAGALSWIPDVKEKFQTLAEVFEFIGQAFGGLVGGFLFKILDDVGRGLQKISDVFTNLKDTGSKDASETMLNIADALATFTKVKVNKIDADGIKTTLSSLSGTFDDFFSKLSSSNVNPTKVGSYVDAITKIFSSLSSLPKSGGWWQSITGETMSSTKISSTLYALGIGLKTFVDATKDIPSDGGNIEANLKHIKDMADALNKLPKFDGLNQKLDGTTIDPESIKSYMSAFGAAITSVNGLLESADLPNLKNNTAKISELVGIMNDMATAMDKLPETAAKLHVSILGFNIDYEGGDTDVAGFTAFINSLGPALKGITALSKQTEASSGINIQAIKTASECTTVLADAISHIEKTGGITSIFSGSGDSDKFATDMANLASGLTEFQNGIEVANMGTDAVKNTLTFAKTIGELSRAMVDFNVWTTEDVGSKLSVSLGSLADGMSAFSGRFSTGSAVELVTTVNNLKNAFESLSDMSTSSSSFDMSSITKGFADLATGLGTLKDATQYLNLDSLAAMFGSINDIFANAVTADGASAFIDSIANMLSSEISGLQDTMSSSIIPELEASVSNIVTAFETQMSSSGDAMNAAFNTMLTAAFTSEGADLSSVGLAIGDSIMSGVSGADYSKAPNNLIKAFKQASAINEATKAGKAIGDAAAKGAGNVDASSQGVNLAQGFINGLNSMASRIYSAGVAAGKNAVQGIHDGAGNGSPSVLAYQEGIWLDQGFVNAIYAHTSYIEEAAEYAGNSAIDSLSESMAHVATVFSHDFDVQPVIAPVLDLSNVEAGARAINATFSNTKSISAQSAMSSGSSDSAVQNGSNATGVQFIQNNYSPKALSRYEIYRQTNNQLAAYTNR